MARTKILAATAVLAAGVLALAGCSSSGGGSGDSGNIIKVGGLFSTTGVDSQYDLPEMHGLQMAIADKNKAGGITVNGKKYTFELKTVDLQSDPATSLNAVKKLTSDSSIKVIFGPGTSDTGPSIAQYLKNRDIAYFGAFTTMDAVLDTDGTDNMFRMWSAASVAAKSWIPIAVRELGMKKGTAAIFPNEDVSKSVIESSKAPFANANAPIKQTVLFQSGATNLGPFVSRVDKSQIDGYFLGYAVADVTNLIQTVINTPNAPRKFITYSGTPDPGLHFQNQIDGFAYQIFTRSLSHPNDPTIADWAKRYKEFRHGAKFGPQEDFAVGYYDPFMAYAKALEEVGDTSNADAAAAKLRGSCYKGVRNVCWDDRGHADASFDIGIILPHEDEKIITVQPASLK